jgi:hypothetical protein
LKKRLAMGQSALKTVYQIAVLMSPLCARFQPKAKNFCNAPQQKWSYSGLPSPHQRNSLHLTTEDIISIATPSDYPAQTRTISGKEPI